MWILILFVSTVPFLLILYLEKKNYGRLKILKKFPGPPLLPILGNAHQMGKTPSVIIKQFFQWWSEAGFKNFRLVIGPYHNILVTEPKDIEFILTSKTLIDKSDIYDMLHPWLGMGLITSTGMKWFTHRKMITPTFHFKILQEFHETMYKYSNKFIDKLREASHGDSIFDFQPMVSCLTLDIIADTAMGVPINAMDNNNDQIVEAFRSMSENINMRAYHPLKRSNALYRFAPDYPQYCKTLKILKDFTYEVISKRIEARKLDETQKPHGTIKDVQEDYTFSVKRKYAFLDTLLTARISGNPLTKEEIYEEVATFMFAGHDTTTSGISFTIYLLSIFPEIQKKVYEEQKEILGENIKGEVTYQQINEMQYLDLVIKEALRLFPSVPIIARYADKDYDMNGVTIPKGTSVNVFLMALGYNEKYFPDPYRMNPERWLADQRTHGPFEYVPFSAGLRNCIGQKFAMHELKTVISTIVRNFEILPPLDELISKDGCTSHFIASPAEVQAKRLTKHNNYVPILSVTLILKSENGIWLRLRERV